MRKRSPRRSAAAAILGSLASGSGSDTARQRCCRRIRPLASACSIFPSAWWTRNARPRGVSDANGNGLFDAALAERLLQNALVHGGDFSELYAERRSAFSLSLDDRKVEKAQSGFELGASIRVVAGDATYFGYVDGLEERDLERLADAVASAVR